MLVFRSVTVTSLIAASMLTILTEVLVLAFQCVVVLDTLCLTIDSLLERSMSLNFRQLLFVVNVASKK